MSEEFQCFSLIMLTVGKLVYLLTAEINEVSLERQFYDLSHSTPLSILILGL